MDIFVDFINWLIDGLAEGLAWVISFLPQSPIDSFNTETPAMVTLSHITWFIPFPTMLVHFAAMLVTIGIYYLYRIVARWLKLVRS